MNPAYLIAIFAVIFYYFSKKQLDSYSDELSQRFELFGDTSNPPIVIIPGLDGVTTFFDDVIPLLSREYRVILFYLPLRPRSMPEANYTFPFIVKKLDEVLDEIGLISDFRKDLTIIGESFGGVVAQHYAFIHPTQIHKLVLLSSLAKTDLPPEVLFKLNYLLPTLKLFGQFFPVYAQQLFALIHSSDITEANEPQFVKDKFIQEAGKAHFFSVMARINIVSHLDIQTQTQSLRTPCLVVYGQDDHFTSKLSLQLYSLLPTSTPSLEGHPHPLSRLVPLPGGHLPHITHPQTFASLVISFLKDT